MNVDEISKTLVESNILQNASEGGFTLSPEFTRSIDRITENIEMEGVSEDYLSEDVRSEELLSTLSEIFEESPVVVAYYCAIQQFIPSLSHDRTVQITATLLRFDREPELVSGVPDQFLPVRGEVIPGLVKLTKKAIVYVWDEDCEPCDLVKGDLENTLEDDNREISLFAVYGPASSKILYENYDVVGAPTTLFFVNGAVDARLQGAYEPAVVEIEVDKLHSM